MKTKERYFASSSECDLADTLTIKGKIDSHGKDGSKRFVSGMIVCDYFDWEEKTKSLRKRLGKNIILVY